MAAKFELKVGRSGKYSFNLKAANSQVILTSETYNDRKGANKGIQSVKKNAANEKRYEVKKTKNGEQYFVLKASNGEIIGRSESYKSTRSLKSGMASVQKNAPDAAVVDLTAQPAKGAKAAKPAKAVKPKKAATAAPVIESPALATTEAPAAVVQ